MLVEPERTQYDLKFRLFRFPVRVHPLFWLGAAILGANALNHGIVIFLIWVAVVFVSILVHELGHALAFRAFGADSHIVLYVFGGLAVPWGDVRGRWRRIVISLAGPVAGFLLCGAIYASEAFTPWADHNEPTFFLYWYLFGVNLYWGIFNLLPVVPLDGGRVSEEVCGIIWKRNGLRVALEISIAVAGLVALYCVACEMERRNGPGWLSNLPWWFPRGDFYTALLFGFLAAQSYQLLQRVGWMQSHWDDPNDDRPHWKR